jgi:hypothetical protein
MNDQAMAALYAALAQAQAEFQPITKNREVMITMKSGGKYKFRYADLDEINIRTRPALTKYGLGLMQIVSSEPNGATFIETRLTHKDGGSVSARLDIKGPREYPDPKEFGAVVSYLRRYQVTPMLGVAADDDIDQRPRHPTGDQDDGGGQGDDGAEISAIVNDLIAKAGAVTTDAEALKFWKDNNGKLARWPNAHAEFKQAVAQHRARIAAAAKTTEGAAS